MSLTWQGICNLRNYQIFIKILFSVSKTTRELLLKWGNDPVQLSSEVKMPQFLVEEVIAETCDETSVMGEHHHWAIRDFNHIRYNNGGKRQRDKKRA